MKKTSLKDIATSRGGISRLARLFDIQPSAVQKAVKAERDITVVEHDDGKVEGYEIRPFPFKHR